MSLMAARAASTSAFGTPKPRNWCVAVLETSPLPVMG
jgi:hypothetical protein